MNAFDKKYEKENSYKRQHKRITKVFHKDYWQNSFTIKKNQ